ncbi:MAG: DUF4340 domain-containing protein [Myxococcota bacterium]
MKQVARSFLSLALLVLVTGVVGWIVWRRAAEPSLGGPRPAQLLLTTSTDEFRMLRIEREGERYAVQRTATGWRVAREAPISTEPERIGQLLGALQRLRAQRVFDEENPAPAEEQLGFSPAHGSVSLYRAEEAEPSWRIEFGATSSFNRMEYARVHHETTRAPLVVMVPSGTRASLLKGELELVDRRVLGARTSELRSLRVTPHSPRADAIAYALTRPGDAPGMDSFVGIEPTAGELDDVTVRQILESLSAAPVSQFLSLDAQGKLSPYGLSPPSLTVTLLIDDVRATKPAEAIERTLWISEPVVAEDGTEVVRVARSDEPWVGVAHPTLWRGLLHSAQALQTKRVTLVDREQVHRLELLLRNGEHVVLERMQQAGRPTWQVLAPEPGPAEPQRVNALLLMLTGLTGDSRALEGPAALDPHRLAELGLSEAAPWARLLDGEGNVLARLRFGNAEGGDVFVLGEGRGFVVRVSQQRLEDIPDQAAELLR